jgi:hypothetical protein
MKRGRRGVQKQITGVRDRQGLAVANDHARGRRITGWVM